MMPCLKLIRLHVVVAANEDHAFEREHILCQDPKAGEEARKKAVKFFGPLLAGIKTTPWW